MNELVKLIEKFAYINGKGCKNVLSDLLKYIVGSFSSEPIKDPSWQYTKEQNVQFNDMLVAYIELMRKETYHGLWHDAWGDLFMYFTPRGGARGQFFTPVDICNLMAETTIDVNAEPTKVCGAFGKRVVIGDPAAGSGRNLLAANAMFVKANARKPYLIAEDIDLDCCRMTAINMMVHGCYGEVICHNTLTNPKGLLCGFLINETLYPFPASIPSLRRKTEPEWFVALR